MPNRGQYRTRLNAVWTSMMQRCHNSSNEYYHNYGGRGIRVCEEWKVYDNFKSWAYANGYKPDAKLTLERQDNDKGYCPDNCCWATRAVQLRNKRTNVRLTAFGETRVQKDWINDPRCLVSHGTFRIRVRQGWSVEKAMLTPPHSKGV